LAFFLSPFFCPTVFSFCHIIFALLCSQLAGAAYLLDAGHRETGFARDDPTSALSVGTSCYFINSLVAAYYYANAGKLRTAAEFYFAFLWLNLDSKKEIGAQTLFAPQVAMVTVRARKRSVTVGVLRFCVPSSYGNCPRAQTVRHRGGVAFWPALQAKNEMLVWPK
jgi:hypothetical protein